MTQSLWCLIRFVSLGMFLVCASLSAQPKSEPTLPWVRKLVSNPGVIVFVHGVTGDDRETWSSGTHFWPSMISRDPAFNGQNIYVYRYPSPRFGHTLSVDEVAENMRLMLKTDGVLNQSQITFVSHSLGGIVTRAFLVKYQREIAPKIRFLYFFATPTTGSHFAKLASFFSKNSQFKQLLPLDSDNYLGTLQSNWLAAGLRIKSYCAYETQPLHGQTIVERASATNLCTEPLDPIEADHINIVKPTSPSSTSYRALKAAFEETSPTHSRPVPNRVASGRPSTPSASVRTPPARSGVQWPEYLRLPLSIATIWPYP